MTDNEFVVILRNAIKGDEKALEIILDLYMPLINRSSIIAGQLDEDLRQLILIRIAFNIGRFQM